MGLWEERQVGPITVGERKSKGQSSKTESGRLKIKITLRNNVFIKHV